MLNINILNEIYFIYRIIKNSFLYKYTNFINITVQIENYKIFDQFNRLFVIK